MRIEGDSPEGIYEMPSRLLTCYVAGGPRRPVESDAGCSDDDIFGFAHTAQGSKSELTSHQPILLAVESTE